MLTREQILSCTSLKRETVAVPEWGGEVIVKELTALERGKYDESFLDDDKKPVKTSIADMKVRLVALCVCDESGNPLFTESDVAELGNVGAAGLDRVFDVAKRLCALGESDMKELEGN